MIGSRTLGLPVASVLAALLLVACDDSGSGPAPATGVPPEATTVVGKIDRFPGGTAVVTSDHVVLSIACQAGVLTLTTSAAVFEGAMDCAQMVTPDVVARFVGKPVMITISATRLRLENPDAGSLDFPASAARAK